MLANFPKYLRFIRRREKFIALAWILGIGLFCTIIAAAYPSLFPDKQAMASMAATLGTPPMIAMMGPLFGVSQLNPAIMMAQECLLWVALAVCIMNIFFVTRYTRTDEELGRNEMMASLPVGRLTNGFATMVGAYILNMIIAAAVGIGVYATNVEGVSLKGAFLYGGSIGMQGFVFAGITLLAAQIFSTASASIGVPFVILILSYLLRGAGDMADALAASKLSASGLITADYKMTNPLSYLSPLGLGLKVEAFYKNDHWPIFILFIEALIFMAIALAVNAVRDVGAGIVPAKAGRSHASVFLRNPLGFAWRMSKGTFLGWAVGLLFLGMSYASVINSIDTFLNGNEMLKKMVEASGNPNMAYDFIAMIGSIMMLMTSIPLISTINKFRNEERRGRLEQIFAGSVSRQGLFGSFLFIAVIEAVLYPFLYGAGMWSIAKKAASLTIFLESSYVYLPALLFMIGMAALLVGVLPNLNKLTWILLTYSFIVVYFGRMIPKMPAAASKITPYGYIPQLPVEKFTAAPEIVISLLALALAAVGFAGIRKRDIGA